jgi:hypothetical protein
MSSRMVASGGDLLSQGVYLPKYHRRWQVSLPCSEWERVVPRRYHHRTNLRVRAPEHSIASTHIVGFYIQALGRLVPVG